jgi:hypothetical protein
MELQLLHGLVAGLLLQFHGRMQLRLRVRCGSATRRALVFPVWLLRVVDCMFHKQAVNQTRERIKS